MPSTIKPATARVGVQSGLWSKINWTQVIAAASAVLVLFGIEIDARTQAEICAGIVAIQGVITVILRTWFTNTVTPQSLEQ